MLLGFLILSAGCAAVTNPVADGIPVNRLPEEFRGKSREELKPISLTLLRQKPISIHKVDVGDVLGIFIENVLGEKNSAPPIRFDAQGGQNPALGFPILVQEDGTISLPYVDPIKVSGLTLIEVQNKIIDEYVVRKKILKPEGARILVTLLQARRYHILVMREDGGSPGVNAIPQFGTNGNIIGTSRKGSGFNLDLPIGENDILNALARSGGLPGTDAKNEVIIHKKNSKNPEAVMRIPLRLKDGEPPPFKPEDVVLDNGDIVFLESRDAEVFYTAGLLGSAQFPLPRDYDLDIVQAIAQVRGPLLNGGFGQAQFNANSVSSGLGNPSPSLVTILRKTAYGKQLPIRVDLNKAMYDPRERIIVQPGDILVLQERPGEAFVRYITQQSRFNFIGTILSTPDANLTNTINVP